MRRARLVFALLLLGSLLAAPRAAALPLPDAPDCPVLPADNPWNARVDDLPVAQNSRRLIRAMGRSTGLHPDFGSGNYQGSPIGIPITVVGSDQPTSEVRFQYDDESDPGPYPIPDDVAIEGGPDSDGDRHALVIDRDACYLYELFALYPREAGGWRAGSGAIWDMTSNDLRPKGWTSADAAGLQIVPGLARFDEVERGVIDHALRFTMDETRAKYIYPARHEASDDNSRRLPPMGLRVRLKKSFDISGYPPQAQIVLRALKRYGLMLADNGSDWYISGAPDPGWDNDDLHSLGDVKGRNFVVVDTSSLRP